MFSSTISATWESMSVQFCDFQTVVSVLQAVRIACTWPGLVAWRKVPLATSTGGLLSNSRLISKFMMRRLLLNRIIERLKMLIKLLKWSKFTLMCKLCNV